jgi:hypothetical protein
MNQSKTLQKLVSLLGDSENDPKLQALFIELGEKFPLRRPRKDQFIFLYFILDYLFWLMCLLVGYAFFRKIKVKL